MYQLILSAVGITIAGMGLWFTWKKFKNDAEIDRAEWFEVDYFSIPDEIDGFKERHYKSFYFISRKTNGSIDTELVTTGSILKLLFDPVIPFSTSKIDENNTRIAFKIPPNGRVMMRLLSSRMNILPSVISHQTEIKQTFLDKRSTSEARTEVANKSWQAYLGGLAPVLILIAGYILTSVYK